MNRRELLFGAAAAAVGAKAIAAEIVEPIVELAAEVEVEAAVGIEGPPVFMAGDHCYNSVIVRSMWARELEREVLATSGITELINGRP
jgi:hypothetical protein